MPHSSSFRRKKARSKSRKKKSRAKSASRRFSRRKKNARRGKTSVKKAVGKSVPRRTKAPRVVPAHSRPLAPDVRDTLALSVLSQPFSRPQFLSLQSLITAGDDYTVNEFTVPVVPVGDSGSVMVMELLSLDWYINPGDLQFRNQTIFAFLCSITNRLTGATVSGLSMEQDCANPLNFGNVFIQHNLVTDDQTTTTGDPLLGVGVGRGLSAAAATWTMPLHIDMTDGLGNGFVFAADRLTLVTGGLGDVSARTQVKIKYRQIILSALEYIQIAQSQT